MDENNPAIAAVRELERKEAEELARLHAANRAKRGDAPAGAAPAPTGAAPVKMTTMQKYGPGAERPVTQSAYDTGRRGDNYEGKVDAAGNRAYGDMNSTSAIERFNVDGGQKMQTRSAGDAPWVANPTIGRAAPVTSTAATMSQARTDGALGAAQGHLDQSGMARQAQVGQLSYLDQMQQGRGPSVGALTAQHGATRAGGLMNDAGAQAARAMLASQSQAQSAYGSASMRQGQLTRDAAYNSGNMLLDNADAGIKAQASMAARARGGNVGAMMLNAQNNGAAGFQRAGVDASRMMADANRQASDQSFNAQHAAQNADLQARIQAGGSLERGNIAAANVGADMMLEGSKIRSSEQLAATGMYGDAVNTLRGGDLSGAQTGNAIAGTSLAADTAAGDLSRFNSDLALRTDTFNADDRFRYLSTDADNRIRTNTLNSGMERDFANMNLEAQKFADGANFEDDRMRDFKNSDAEMGARQLYGQEYQNWVDRGIGQEESNANRDIRYQEFMAGQHSGALDRVANVETGNASIRAQRDAAKSASNDALINGIIGGVTTLGAAGLVYYGGQSSTPDGSSSGGYGNDQAAGQAAGQSAKVSSDATQVDGVPIQSDERLKKNIRPADRAASAMTASFRDAKPYTYEYKDKSDGDGEFTGPMAQDLPPSVRTKRPDGKMVVDTGRLAMLMSSSLGEQQRRLDRLERRV